MPHHSRNRDQADQRLRATVDSLPTGRVATYGQIATEAGLPGRARRVGQLLANLETDSDLCWHRVLGAGGQISLARERPAWHEQRARLLAEGVECDDRGRVDS